LTIQTNPDDGGNPDITCKEKRRGKNMLCDFPRLMRKKNDKATSARVRKASGAPPETWNKKKKATTVVQR